jgi:hypothetical protein
MAGELIVEQLEGETLVYDTASDEAHTLSGAGAVEFLAAKNEVSRRDVLRQLALAGAAAAGTAPLMRSIVAPAAAQAQSPLLCNNGMCPGGLVCCGNTVCVDTLSCCSNGTSCSPAQCCNNVCCNNNGETCCPQTNACGFASGLPCTLASDCCSGQCNGGSCA